MLGEGDSSMGLTLGYHQYHWIPVPVRDNEKDAMAETYGICNPNWLIFDDKPRAKIDSIGAFSTFIPHLHKQILRSDDWN